MGAALVVNSVFWGLDLTVPGKANVDYVDPYQPLFYGFKGHRRGIKAADHALGKVLPAGQRCTLTLNPAFVSALQARGVGPGVPSP
ncbi:MAG: hypothetical protein HC783_08335 [Rhodobacteraceae bacterium]|nr:hypothetical protein [Paracoccaceae bacterium]